MNLVIEMGRLTRDPEIRMAGDTKAANYTLAVNRPSAKDGQQEADFIRCVAFGKNADFAEKYLKKGTKILIQGRLQTGSYTNKDGVKVYTTDVVVAQQEFAESKGSASASSSASVSSSASSPAASASARAPQDAFADVDDDEELPFN